MSMRKIVISILLCLATLPVFGTAENIPDPCDHPRLVLKAGEEAAVKEAISKGGIAAQAYSYVKTCSDKLLTTPPCQRVMTGRRLLHVSREVLKRVFYLSTMYRLDGDRKYLDRASEEMLSACRFTDWNPSHFLDVAEMTMAISIGYDWLYSELSENQRSEIRQAILEKGLRPSEGQWFLTSSNNWNQVCNAGMVCGALAVWEDAPQEARAIVARSLESNPISLGSYSPEGCYPEGTPRRASTTPPNS